MHDQASGGNFDDEGEGIEGIGSDALLAHPVVHRACIDLQA